MEYLVFNDLRKKPKFFGGLFLEDIVIVTILLLITFFMVFNGLINVKCFSLSIIFTIMTYKVDADDNNLFKILYRECKYWMFTTKKYSKGWFDEKEKSKDRKKSKKKK